MAIIITENGKNAQRVEQSRFGLEDNLQAYIYDNPESIPLYDIADDISLLILAREFPTQSGPIDALGVDRLGNLYVVETKLYKNPDKRTVVAQALDYGASLWRHATDFDEFLRLLDAKVQDQFGMGLHQKITEYFKLESTDALLDNVRLNLNSGNIKFVVLMDHLESRLKDLILYVNQNSNFDVYAVEFEYYKHASFEIVIPKLYGAEARKEVVSTKPSARKTWTPEMFWEEAAVLSADKLAAIRTLYDWTVEHASSIKMGNGSKTGAFTPRFDSIGSRSFYAINTDGSIYINYGYLENDTQRIALREALRSAGITLPKLLDISNEQLPHAYPTVSADDFTANAQNFIRAFAGFIIS